MTESSMAANPTSIPPRRPINPWIIAISVMFSTFMEVLDTTVVNVSLPHIAGSLSASINEATWALTSYLVANAIILPMTGWLSNYFGRKRLLMTSVAGFTIASFFCGFATSLPMLIICRIVQGTAGGAMQPISQAVLLESFPGEKRGKAMAFWGLGIVVAPILGPVLGGWLTDSYSWRWVFYINIPVGIISIIMTKLFMFDPSYIRRREGGIDYWGIGMLVVGIGSLQIMLDKGQQEDWLSSNFIATLLCLCLISLTAFVIYEWQVKSPVVDLRVFKNYTYAIGTLLITLMGFVLYGSMVLLPLWIQTLLGYPSLQAGITMSPRGMGSFLAMPIVGILSAKFDPRKFLCLGLFMGSMTLFQLTRLNLNAGYWNFFWPQFMQGVAMACMFVPLTTITMASIPKEKIGNATSVYSLLRNIGGSMGIATITTLVERLGQNHANMLVAHISATDPQSRATYSGIRQLLMAHGSAAATATKQAQAALFGMVQKQAVMLSFLDAFRLLAVIFLLMIPLVWLTKKPPQGAPPPAAH